MSTHLFCCFVFGFVSASHLHWTVITSPAIFYGTVELKCTIDGVLEEHITRKWERGMWIIISKNKTTDYEKFRERITNDSFVLQILNFNVSDLGRDYTCKYGFDVYTSHLSIAMADFELHPTNQTLRKSWNVTDGYLVVTLDFFLVYPVPVCEVFFNNFNFTKHILTKSEHVGVVYSFLLSLNISVNSSCQTNIKISCLVGTSEIIIENSQTDDKFCRSDGNKANRLKFLWMLSVLSLGIPISIYIKIKWQRIKDCSRVTTEKKGHPDE